MPESENGDQTEEQYSSWGLTRVRYAVDLSYCECTLMLRRRNPSVWFAFLQMLSICVCQVRLFEIVKPKYLADDTDSRSVCVF